MSLIMSVVLRRHYLTVVLRRQFPCVHKNKSLRSLSYKYREMAMTSPVGTGISSGPLTDAIKEDHQEVRRNLTIHHSLIKHFL